MHSNPNPNRDGSYHHLLSPTPALQQFMPPLIIGVVQAKLIIDETPVSDEKPQATDVTGPPPLRYASWESPNQRCYCFRYYWQRQTSSSPYFSPYDYVTAVVQSERHEGPPWQSAMVAATVNEVVVAVSCATAVATHHRWVLGLCSEQRIVGIMKRKVQTTTVGWWLLPPAATGRRVGWRCALIALGPRLGDVWTMWD
ncbi:unnamed protein product [Lactuca saligna]|uniref:Uncharacterized protein n=1 Tax=Lactuca saligna TaxID=75948 RepID=A0AA35Z5T2_LACSI|nr:unnamed protein product [Lactuca saligna]